MARAASLRLTPASAPLARLTLCALPALLAACGTLGPGRSSAPVAAPRTSASTQAANERAAGVPVLPPAGSGHGGYYKDDGPGENPPPGLVNTPDAEPRIEPYAKSSTNKPYVVFGKTYTPILDDRAFVERGTATWYGKKFHGQRTSSGEPYDMYKMTAAHPTLPIPSYARVTNLQNGAQVIVRINDRGPFHSTRIIDLSYTAALKLGYLGPGSHEVQVERLLPDEIARLSAQHRDGVITPAPLVARAATAPATAPVLVSAAPSARQQAVENMLRGDAPLADGGETAPGAAGAAPALLPVATSAPAARSGRFYLQLGAFSQQAHAETSRAALAPALNTLPAPAVVRQGSLFKLLSGPFASRGEAQEAASRLQAAPDWQARVKPVVVERALGTAD